MRAILIDPFLQSLAEIDYSGNWKDIAKIIGCSPSPFTQVRIEEDHHIYLDDEGLYKEPQRFFRYIGYPSPLAGRGLVLQASGDGEEMACAISLSTLEKRVTFPLLRFVGMEQSIQEGAETGFGKGTIITNRARFSSEH